MSLQHEMLTKGDWIVHAHFGVGQIKGKENKSFNGEKQTFFRVKTFNGAHWLPLGNAESDHVRPIASKNQISRALCLIRRAPKKLP